MGVDAGEAPFEGISGIEAFAACAAKVVLNTRLTLDLFSYDLDRRVYGSEDFIRPMRKFLLAHGRARVRVLVNAPSRAISGGNRLVNFGRTLSSFVEFRELPENKQGLREDYLIADGRVLLIRASPDERQAKYFAEAPHVARAQQRVFDSIWDESVPSQELRGMKI